jgi:hypothetical protein
VKRASSCLDHPFELLASVEGAEVEHLDDRTGFVQFRGVIWWRGELFQDFPSHTCGGLLHSHDRRVAEITFHEENHLFVSHEDVVAADIVQPPLYGCFDPCFVFIGSSAGGSQARRDGRDKCFGVGRYEVFGELHKLRMCASHVAELGCTEFGEVGLQVVRKS